MAIRIRKPRATQAAQRSRSQAPCKLFFVNFALDSAARRDLGYKLIDRVDEYFASLHSRPVQLPLERRTFEPLRNVLPETGLESPEAAAQFLDDICTELIDQGFAALPRARRDLGEIARLPEHLVWIHGRDSISGLAGDNVAVTSVTWANSTGGAGTATGTAAWSATVTSPVNPATA